MKLRTNLSLVGALVVAAATCTLVNKAEASGSAAAAAFRPTCYVTTSLLGAFWLGAVGKANAGRLHGFRNGFGGSEWMGTVDEEEEEEEKQGASDYIGGNSHLLRSSMSSMLSSSSLQQQHLRSLQAPTSTCSLVSGTRAIYVVSQPSSLGITVDGLTNDWDLTDAGYDFVTLMYNAGKTDQPARAKLYLRFNCATRTLCALVKTLPDICLDGTQQFFKDPSNGGEVTPVTPITNVVEGGKIVGWEGCFNPSAYNGPTFNGCRSQVWFHAEWTNCTPGASGNTVSSGQANQFIGIDLRCPCIAGADNSVCNLPPPFPQTTPPATGTCCGDTCTPPDQACLCSCTSSITCPPNVTVECGNVTALANTGTATATKSGSCSSAIQTVTSTDVASTTTPGVCPSKITRTWTASLQCTSSSSVGRTNTCVQEILVNDTTKPELYNVPGDATLECREPTVVDVTASDTCAGTLTPVRTTTNTSGCGITKNVTTTWTATDNCGNTRSASQLTWIRDTTNPSLVGVPASTGASCDAIPAPATVSATDACDPSVTPTFNETNNTVDGECQAGKTITRTWTAVDDCLNKDTKVQVITLTDDVKPYFTSDKPADTAVSCEAALPPFGDLSATDSCGSARITKVEVNNTGSCPQNVRVNRTWTATDLCGNKQSVSQIISVYDNKAPSLTGVPADTGASCDNVPAPADVTATDTCDPSVTPTFNETNNTVVGECQAGKTVTRTWTATDGCSNSDSKAQVITLTDDVKPNFTSDKPGDASLRCDEPVPRFEDLLAVDSCGTANVTKVEVIDPGSCPQNKVITRTWRATDLCSNEVSVSQKIIVTDTANPTLEGVPGDTGASCDNVPVPAAVTARDACDTSVDLARVETTTRAPGVCQAGATITRTWTATDDCGNSDSKSQVITLTDTVDPYFVSPIPWSRSIRCDEPVPPFENLLAADSCGTVDVTKTEDVTPGSCPQNKIITRKWTATDLCHNEVDATQAIVISDTASPALVGVPADAQASCDNVPAPADVNAYDACDPSVDVILVEFDDRKADTCQAGKTITRRWTATDDCGNFDVKYQVITLTDSVPPNFTTAAPTSTSLSCEASLPSFVDLTAVDSCGTTNVTKTEVVTPGLCPQNKVITRTWTATDLCSNQVNVSQTITVSDTANPILEDVPGDTSALCDNVPDPADVTAHDACDSSVIPTLDETNNTVVGECQTDKTITRKWTATDDCGNFDTKVQVITLTDSVPPNFTSTAPASTSLSCEAALPSFVDLPAVDSCGTANVTKTEVVAPGSCPQNKVITRTWTATDLCSNEVSVSQKITVYDTASPILDGAPGDTSVSCDAIPAPPTVTAHDNCDLYVGVLPTEVSDVEDGKCKAGKTINRTWAAADDCGNTVTASQTIKLTDTKPPTLSGVPASTTVECSAIPPAATVTGSDTCGGVVNVTMVETNTSGVCGNRKVTRVWSASDVCGNAATPRTQVLTLADTTKPTLTCPSDATVACNGCITDTCRGRPTVGDNCDSNPTVTYVDTYSPATLPTNSSTDVSQTITRTWSAKDDCDNTKTCTQTIIKTGVLSQVKVSWSLNGAVDSTLSVTFALYQGPAGGGTTGTLLASPSTLGVASSGVVLDVYLNPAKTYTICESPVPAGWSTNVTANGVPIVPYPGDAGSNNQIYCFDFQPTDCSAALNIAVANRVGGGCPRTPGYWKNWNNCTGSKQALTAAKNGGKDKGYYIIEDLLPIVWDDTNNDTKFFTIGTCPVAVQVLTTTTLTTCPTNPNKQYASDPVVALAKHLLSSQLNAKAKACISANITATIKDAEKLLDDLNYLGCKLTTTPTTAQTTRLRSYATILDNYNNGNICPGCHG